MTRRRGTTTGTITDIHITIAGPGCVAGVDGTGAAKDDGQINFRYVNKTRELTFPCSGGNLHYYQVNGCAGRLHDPHPGAMGALAASLGRGRSAVASRRAHARAAVMPIRE